jgi:hypothetical protein
MVIVKLLLLILSLVPPNGMQAQLVVYNNTNRLPHRSYAPRFPLNIVVGLPTDEGIALLLCGNIKAKF